MTLVERGRERILKNISPRRVRARFECRKYPPAGEPFCNRFEGHANRGRMMREVIDHRHSCRLSHHLLTAHDALEGAQPAGNLVAGHSERAQQHVNAERVGDVHSAADRKMDRFMDSIAVARHRKSRAVARPP